MQRDYVNYLGVALKEGMKPEEMQNLFKELEKKSNTKQGKKVLRLFAKGIGKTKKKTLVREYEQNQANITQEPQQKSFQYVYKND